MWEWLFGGEDDKNVFDNIGDWWTGDDDTETYTQESVSDSAFADLIESDPDFADFYNEVLEENNIYDQEFWDLYNEISYADQGGEPDEGYFDWAQGYEQTFDDDDWSMGDGNILSMLLGGGGQKREGNQLGPFGEGLGSLLSSPLAALLLAKDQYDGRKADLYVPKGQEVYGSGAGVGSLPDYRISNIQPALLPGMAYANQPTTFNADPPGMQAGGLAHHHPQLHSHAHGSRPNDIPGMPGMQDHLLRPGQPGSRALPMPYKPDGMQAGGVASLENRMDGPGDITQAMLEPGEFVMTRKATENLTPEYLYKLMHQAENAGRMR
tara:strand:- start:14750 stop:15718 length:969 start_codon:yes stop_codon:yes gene_type:complete